MNKGVKVLISGCQGSYWKVSIGTVALLIDDQLTTSSNCTLNFSNFRKLIMDANTNFI